MSITPWGVWKRVGGAALGLVDARGSAAPGLMGGASRNASRIGAAVFGSRGHRCPSGRCVGHGHHVSAPHRHYRSLVTPGAIQYGSAPCATTAAPTEPVCGVSDGEEHRSPRGHPPRTDAVDRSGQTYRFDNARLNGHSHWPIRTAGEAYAASPALRVAAGSCPAEPRHVRFPGREFGLAGQAAVRGDEAGSWTAAG